MSFRFISENLAADHREINTRYEAYMRYLQAIAEALPTSAFAFASAPWHYDARNHQCPHDSWLESLTISELHEDSNVSRRSTAIAVRLLGAYHDGNIYLEYVDVNAYDLHLAGESGQTAASHRWHGDWYVDEVRLGEDNRVVHEILFSDGGRWLIECCDILYRWVPATEGS